MNKLPMTLGPERRYVPLDSVEMREAKDGGLEFSGHAAVFGQRSWIGPKKWGFWEEVRHGAFAKTIREADVRMLQNHDPNFPLARSTVKSGVGSLRLSEDSKGLVDEASWLPTSYAKDLAIAVRAKVITQQSFGFKPVADKEVWTRAEDGQDLRSLGEVALYDVSPVTFPAYTETDASIRAAQMGILLEAAELPDDDTYLLVRALRMGTITPELAPTLRAAGEALGDLARRCEPASATRDERTDPGLEARAARIRQAVRTLAVTYAAATTKG